MTLRHMKIFVAVYQQKSITLASNSLHLAQPSVSLAIRSWRNIIISACSTASPDGFTRRRTGIASMNMHSISCHFFQKWKTKFPPGMQMPRSILAPASLFIPACSLPCQSLSGAAPGNQNLCNGQKYRHNRAGSHRQSAGFCPGRRHCHSPGNHFRGLFCRYALHGRSSRTSACRQPDGHPRRRCFLPSSPLREPGSAGREIVESLFFIRRYPDHARLGKRQHTRSHPRRPKRSRHRNFTGASRPGCTEIRRSCLPSASARHPDPQPIPDPRPQQIPSSSAEEFLNLCRMWKF